MYAPSSSEARQSPTSPVRRARYWAASIAALVPVAVVKLQPWDAAPHAEVPGRIGREWTACAGRFEPSAEMSVAMSSC